MTNSVEVVVFRSPPVNPFLSQNANALKQRLLDQQDSLIQQIITTEVKIRIVQGDHQTLVYLADGEYPIILSDNHELTITARANEVPTRGAGMQANYHG